MYHFYESIQSIEQGLSNMIFGLREFQAGIENLRVLFQKIEELAASNLEAELSTTEAEESDDEHERRGSNEMGSEDNVDKRKAKATSDGGGISLIQW